MIGKLLHGDTNIQRVEVSKCNFAILGEFVSSFNWEMVFRNDAVAREITKGRGFLDIEIEMRTGDAYVTFYQWVCSYGDE